MDNYPQTLDKSFLPCHLNTQHFHRKCRSAKLAQYSNSELIISLLSLILISTLMSQSFLISSLEHKVIQRMFRWETFFFLVQTSNSLNITKTMIRRQHEIIITARKRSLRRLYFYRCLSVQGGMRGWGRVCVWLGACMAGGHAWLGGMHGWGACVARGACMAGGVWGWGAYMAGGVWHACLPQQILWLWHTVNERAVCILLKCILVSRICCAQIYISHL